MKPVVLLSAVFAVFLFGTPSDGRPPLPVSPNCPVCKLLQSLNIKIDAINFKVDRLLSGEGIVCNGRVPRSCADLYKCGRRTNGVYTIDPDGLGSFKVYCDQTTAGGGWTVFQKRIDGSVDFYKGWADYKRGFGDVRREFWLGLDNINRLTTAAQNKLRVDLEEVTGQTVFAVFSSFAVASGRALYRLSIGRYTGTAGNSLSHHQSKAFTTKDRDHDTYAAGNCAALYKGGWWYGSCHDSNLNGLYHLGTHKSYADGVNWKTWKGYRNSMKRAEMKIRPVNF